nr:family 78 glycoside hydrolase catalytic domain [Leifsonia psychrotolerans]
MRKEFTVTSPITAAKIYVAAGGYANVSLNGTPINDELLSPGFTDYDDHAQYTVTDLTSQLKQGGNALGIELGRGFYGLTNGNVWNWQKAPWHDEPVAKAVLRIEYADGTTQDVVTDGSWTLHDGPTVLDDLYGGETYDASREQPGFDTVGFADSAWDKAVVVAGPKGVLVNQSQQPIRITEELPASSVTEVIPGTYVVKFPRMLAGNVKITATGDAGTTIRFQYAEKLRTNGRLNADNNGGFQNGFQTDRFILAGTGAAETWAAQFSYKGFQYIEVSGWPEGSTPTAANFTAQALHTDTEETGSFESANSTMNATHRAVVDTLLNNLHGIPTDTPMFEKNGWTGDAAVGAEMFLMNLDSQNLFAKWIGDINDSRDPVTGAPYVIAPSSANWGDWGKNPSWHAAYIQVPWALYQYGGDIRVLQQYYDGMKQYTDAEFTRSPGGIADARLGDWVSPEASPAGGNAPEDVHVSATAFLYTMLTTMEKTATLLGKPADAAHFAGQAATVKDAFNATFLDTASGSYRGSGDRGYRQTHNVLALAFGMTPDEATATRVAASLAADVVAKGDKLNTGTLGTKYLLPMLTKYGYADLAYRVAVQKEYPSWGYMIENGATSMWEHWSLESRSLGHYFLGTVDDWFYHDVAGIRSSETTGYRDISIAPQVTDQLEWAKATTKTPFGPVSVDWAKSAGSLSLKTHVPVGSTATVTLPAVNTWAVTEGGLALSEVAGVRAVAQVGDTVRVTIGSGDYAFTVNADAGAVGAVLQSLDALTAQIDGQHSAGELNNAQASTLAGLVDASRAHALDALTQLSGNDATAVARSLAQAIGALDAVDTWIATESLNDAPRTALEEAAESTRVVAGATVSTLLGVSASAALESPASKPGETGAVTASVANGGNSAIATVTARIDGVEADWAASETPVPLAGTLAGGATESAALRFTVPLDQVPGEVPATIAFGYLFDGQTIELRRSLALVVDSALTLTNAVFDPSSVAPGQSSQLTVTVSNTGSQAAVGHLEVAVPAGWTTPLPTGDVLIPAGEDVALTVPVFVPNGADRAALTASVTARFVYDGVTFAQTTAALTVVLAPVTTPPVGYDHVDLGNKPDEDAHGLTASPSSGINTEAGLTRRYAGHLTDNSFFEFNATVVAGKPFLIRAIETYDKPQTKKYKVFVDGTEVIERLFSHTGGLGTETYEFVVDAARATSGTVRIRFQNLTDHGFYDPSIADVWTLPVAADTVAPQVTATTDPSAPNRATGWYTQAPVGVTLQAQDDRPGAPVIEYALGSGAMTNYSAALSLGADGEHALSYRATDGAGNASGIQHLAVKIDTVAPVTTATPGAEFVGQSAFTSGTIRFSAADATSGVAHTRYRVNGGEWTTGDAVTITTAGAFTVEYASVDVAGNTEAAQSITGTIIIPDLTAPTVDVALSGAGNNGWHVAGAAATLTATDDQSGVDSIEYSLNDGAWTTYTAPVTLPEGTTVFAYRATDNEGNVSAPRSTTVTVDATEPTVWGWISTTGRVSAVGADAGSGVDHLEYAVDGSTWVSGLTQLIAETATPSTLQVRAVDRAGNVGEALQLSRTDAPTTLDITAGSRVLVESSGFTPGATVRVELHSTPTVLGTVIADARGVISALGTVPADFPGGQHSLVLVVVTTGTDPGTNPGTNPGTDPDTTVTIPTDVIASTGVDMLPFTLISGLLLLAGVGLVLIRRRRARER